MNVSVVRVALAALVASTAASCACSSAASVPGFRIFVEAPYGHYSLAIWVEDVATTIDFEFTADGLSCGGSCGFGSLQVEGNFWPERDGFALQVAHPGQQTGPSEVTLQIQLSNVLVYDGTLVADYMPSYPNGESCGSDIDTADALITVE